MEWKKLHCFRCSFEWYPLNPEKLPKTCARCRSRYWNAEEAPKPGPKRKKDGQDKG